MPPLKKKNPLFYQTIAISNPTSDKIRKELKKSTIQKINRTKASIK